MNIGFVIINYHGIIDTLNCLKTLFESIKIARKEKQTVVCLIDNSSNKDELIEIQKSFSFQNFITKKIMNRGFGDANNKATALIKDNCDVFAFINNDTVIPEIFVKDLFEVLEKNPQISIFGPKIMLFPEKKKLQSVGGIISFLGYVKDKCVYMEESKCNESDLEYSPFFITGAAFIMRKKDFFITGGFDENIFMYWEDVDLCWRARLLEMKILYTPEIKIFHKFQGSTSRSMTPNKLKLSRFSALYVLTKNFSLFNLILRLPLILSLLFLSSFIRPIKERKVKFFFVYYSALFAYLKYLPKCLKERAKVQEARVTPDKNILSYNSLEPIKNFFTRGK